FVLHLSGFPSSICVLEALLTAGLLGGARLLCRALLQRGEGVRRRQRRDDPPGRVLIVGAGAAAEILIRELPQHGYTAVGCVDDDPLKQGVKVHGVSVLGTIEQVPAVASSYQIDELMIAMPSDAGARMRRVVD